MLLEFKKNKYDYQINLKFLLIKQMNLKALLVVYLRQEVDYYF